jgi:NhaP-type Na+/H+ or K+/H+ antiporter
MHPFGVLLFLALGLTIKVSEPWSTVVPGVVLAVALLNATLIWFAPLMARRAATKALGIKVTNANYPPNDDGSYRAWCSQNHIEPNRAVPTSME